MSYDIELVDPVSKNVLHLESPHHMRGGTYAVGGTTEASLNVTYNYSKHLYRVMGEGGIRSIYGKSAVDSIPMLEKAIAQLGDDISEDYWEPTEGNVKRALLQLYTLAKMRPDGVWNGD
jgi:hypothetical protein